MTDRNLPLSENFVDLRHLRCPMLSWHIQNLLERLQPGGIVTVVCSDPLSVIDVPWLVIKLDDEIITQHSDQDTITFVIRKGTKAAVRPF